MNQQYTKILIRGFEQYCIETENLLISTATNYKRILILHFKEILGENFEKDNFISIFDEKYLIGIKSIVKDNALRATFLAFLSFLKAHEFIKDEYEYLKVKERIQNLLVGESKPTKKNTNIFTPNEVKNLFKVRFVYKTIEESKIAPLIAALSFFCMFKQNEIFQIKVSDIDLVHRKIRNIKYVENINMAKFLNMNDTLYGIVKEYIKYRETLDTDFEELIIIQNKPIKTNSLNTMLGVFKRSDNAKFIGYKKISCEMLIRTMIYYQMNNNLEEAVHNFFNIFKKQNEDFNSMFSIYIDTQRNSNLDDFITLKDIKDIFNEEEGSLESLKAKKNNREESTSNEFSEVIPYSAELDISVNDLEDYDLNNKRNLEDKKITVQRLVRDSSIAKKVKELYNHTCQVCNTRLRKADGGFVAEAHHIKPYNKMHKGDDTASNLLVLCPNCHTQFDDYYYAVNPDTLNVHCVFEDDEKHLKKLVLKHQLGIDYLLYTWDLFKGKHMQ